MKFVNIRNILILLIINPIYCFSAPKVAFSFDDPRPIFTKDQSWQQINQSLLNTLKEYNIQAALFVCGQRIDDKDGMDLLKTWDEQNHLICNHSYSHFLYNSSKITKEDFFNDIIKNDSIIRNFKNYSKLFRFPYLKEGNTIEKRDYLREKFKTINYHNGHVTIDASDWFISSWFDNPKLSNIKDLQQSVLNNAFRDAYLAHIMEKANYYNNLSKELTGREINNVLLLHYSLMNAIFLEDLIKTFKSQGWEIVEASKAYNDEIFKENPDIMPAGESIIWAMAKNNGKYENELRYPAEDGKYEEKALHDFLQNPEIEISKINDSLFTFVSSKRFDDVNIPANGFLAVTEKGIIMIDTPWNNFQTQNLINLCWKQFHKPITLTIITHAHDDRIGGIAALYSNRIKTLGINLTSEFARKNGFRSPDTIIPNDTIIKVGNIPFEIYYPGAGHTKDNIVVYFPTIKLLYGGCFIKSKESLDLGNLADADTVNWEDSINKLIRKFPNIEVVIPGHGAIGSSELINHTKNLIMDYNKEKLKTPKN